MLDAESIRDPCPIPPLCLFVFRTPFVDNYVYLTSWPESGRKPVVIVILNKRHHFSLLSGLTLLRAVSRVWLNGIGGLIRVDHNQTGWQNADQALYHMLAVWNLLLV